MRPELSQGFLLQGVIRVSHTPRGVDHEHDLVPGVHPPHQDHDPRLPGVGEKLEEGKAGEG